MHLIAVDGTDEERETDNDDVDRRWNSLAIAVILPA